MVRFFGEGHHYFPRAKMSAAASRAVSPALAEGMSGLSADNVRALTADLGEKRIISAPLIAALTADGAPFSGKKARLLEWCAKFVVAAAAAAAAAACCGRAAAAAVRRLAV